MFQETGSLFLKEIDVEQICSIVDFWMFYIIKLLSDVGVVLLALGCKDCPLR